LKLLAWLALWAGAASPWFAQPALAWRMGGLALIAHVAWAFAEVHGWSHASAVEATARQVESVIGRKSGGGIWANYAFVLAWFRTSWSWPRLSPSWRRLWWSVFLFMGFNGALVFVTGPARWLGIAWSAVAIVSFAREWNSKEPSFPSKAIREGGNPNPP